MGVEEHAEALDINCLRSVLGPESICVEVVEPCKGGLGIIIAIEADYGAEFGCTEDGVLESTEGVSGTTFVGVLDTWTCVMGAGGVVDGTTVL